MNDLELILNEVEKYRNDLSAYILIESSIGHYETYVDHKYNSNSFLDKKTISIEHTTPFKVPDMTKRDYAKRNLIRIYNHSKYFSPKYLCGNLVEELSIRLNSEFITWLKEIPKILNPLIENKTFLDLNLNQIDIKLLYNYSNKIQKSLLIKSLKLDKSKKLKRIIGFLEL